MEVNSTQNRLRLLLKQTKKLQPCPRTDTLQVILAFAVTYEVERFSCGEHISYFTLSLDHKSRRQLLLV